jgi:hypothetical protein
MLGLYRRKPIISQVQNDLPQTYKFQSSVPTSWRNVIHWDSAATLTTVRNCSISLYMTGQKATKLGYHNKSTLFDFHSSFLTSSACVHRRREQESKCWQWLLGIRTIRPFVWPPYQNIGWRIVAQRISELDFHSVPWLFHNYHCPADGVI